MSYVITGVFVALLVYIAVHEHYNRRGWAEWRAAVQRSKIALKQGKIVPFPPDPPIVFFGNQRKLWNEWRARDAAQRLRE